MALPPSLTAILIFDALLGVLFAYLVFEGFQLSKADGITPVEYRKPWVDKILNGIVMVLSVSLLLTAVTIGYRYYSAF
jgi:hypothetical protein